MGLSAALASAGHSLDIFSAGIEVAGQNVANAGSPGYIREKLIVSTAPSIQQGKLFIGTGALAEGVRQQIDKFLEQRLRAAGSDLAGAAARETTFQQLEATLQELGENDLSSSLNDFLSQLNEVVNQPETQAYRESALNQGVQLAEQITGLRGRVDEMRTAQSARIGDMVTEVNGLVDQIATLNKKIVTAEAGGLLGSDAGGLRTQRYAALTRLAEIVPVKTIEQPTGSVTVYMGQDYLILGSEVQHLEVVSSVDRNVTITQAQVVGTNQPLTGSGGELQGLVSGRDDILGGFVDQLDTLVSTLVFEFNKIHAGGEGVSGFTSLTSDNRISDPTAVLNAAGLDFTPVHGSFQIKITNQLSGATTTQQINIDLDGIGTDTTLNGLQAALDGLGNISATITPDGRLSLTADSDYEFRFSGDSSGTLAALGLNTFFTGSDSATIGVNRVVLADSNLFAAGRGGGPGDNSNAVALAQILDQPLSGVGGITLSDAYDNLIARLAQDSATETAVAKGFAGFQSSLLNQRSQFSGVSLDEEALQILELQKSYQAAARLISVIDDLFTTLLNM